MKVITFVLVLRRGLYDTQLKLALYVKMNAVISSSFSRHGIGIRHTRFLCDEGIPQLVEGTVGFKRLTTTTTSTATKVCRAVQVMQ